MMTLQDLRHQLLSGSVNSDLKSIKNMIGAISLNNEITEKEINDWATGLNEISMNFSDDEIIENATHLPVPPIGDSEEDDTVHLEQKISNKYAIKSFAVCVQ